MKRLLAIILSIITSTALAQETGQGFYLGAGYGAFAYSTNPAFNDEAAYGNLVEKSSGSTLKIYGGYQFNRVIGLELTYTDYGDSTGYVIESGTEQVVNQSPTSFAVAVNAGHSFDNGLRPFALLGLASVYLDADYKFLETNSPMAIKYGLGIEYTPTKLSFAQLRLAYESDTYFANTKTSNEPYYFQLYSIYLGLSLKY